jgi:hypothetical protein
MRNYIRHIGKLCLVATLATASTVVLAGKIYMWQETTEDGNKIKAFGPTPPPGVDAVLVADEKNNAFTNNTKAEGAKDAPAQNQALNDKQKELRARRAQECEAEKGRLATLQNGNTNIRMTLEDGTSRTLSPDEIAEQIRLSQDFLKNACS